MQRLPLNVLTIILETKQVYTKEGVAIDVVGVAQVSLQSFEPFLTSYPGEIQGTSRWPFPGLVNFVPAVAYHFCLNLPKAFLQPWNGLLVVPCRVILVTDNSPLETCHNLSLLYLGVMTHELMSLVAF